MTDPLPPPPDIAAPPPAPTPPALRITPGAWNSAEPHWPRLATGVVLASVAMTLSTISAKPGPATIETPIGSVNVFSVVDVALWFVIAFAVAAAVLAWFTRGFTRGRSALMVAAAVLSVPGALITSLYVAVVMAGLLGILSVVLAVATLGVAGLLLIVLLPVILGIIGLVFSVARGIDAYGT